MAPVQCERHAGRGHDRRGGRVHPGTNTYTITGNTVDFNGAGAQTIPAFAYNNLTSSSTGARTLASSGTVGVAGTFTPGTNAYTVTGSTVNFNGAGAQTIPAFGYNNLTSSSTGARTLASSGTVGVAGTFTPGTNAYTVTGSTVNFNGAGAQTIPAFAYNNLTSSSTGARTLASSGTVGVAGTFTPGTNAYTVTGSTVNFNGAGAQTIPAFAYNNLTSSSTGARTLASSGTVGVAGTFTPGTNAYTVTGSTVSFNGSGAQTVPAFIFNNLTDANTAATVSLTAAATVNGALTVNANAVLDTTTFVLTVNGTYTNNGQIRHSVTQVLSTTAGPFNFADGLGVETVRLSGLSTAFGSTAANTAAGGSNPYNSCGALLPTPSAASGSSRRRAAAQVWLGSPSATMKWPAAWDPTSWRSTAACRAADHGRRWARRTRGLRRPGRRRATARSKQPAYRSRRPARRTSWRRERPI